jgi:hypothetical protein
LDDALQQLEGLAPKKGRTCQVAVLCGVDDRRGIRSARHIADNGKTSLDLRTRVALWQVKRPAKLALAGQTRCQVHSHCHQSCSSPL